MIKKKGATQLSLSKVIIYVLLAVILVIVILAGPKKMGTLFDQVGGSVDEFLVWLGLRGDDVADDLCYVEKASKFKGGPELLEHLGATDDKSEVKICRTWCKLMLRGAEGNMDSAYYIQDGKFFAWTSSEKYQNIDYKTLTPEKEMQRELYQAMVEKAKNLKVKSLDDDDEFVDAWWGWRGLASRMGWKPYKEIDENGEHGWGLTFYYGHAESDGFCLWDVVDNDKPDVGGKKTHWPCASPTMAAPGNRRKIYNLMKSALALPQNQLHFRGVDYSFYIKAKPRGGKSTILAVKIGNEYLGLEASSQTTKDYWNEDVTVEYTLWKYNSYTKKWQWAMIDTNYQVYLPEIKENHKKQLGNMRNYAKIQTFLRSNCR